MDRMPRKTLFDDYSPEPRLQRIQPNIFAKIARVAFRNATLVLLLWCAIIGTASYIAVQKISTVEQRPFEFTVNSAPAENMKILNQNFPHLESLITITLSNSKPQALSQARELLVKKLESQKDKFDLVFAPGTGTYYEDHAILYYSKAEIDTRVAYALSLRPLFSAIAEAPSAESLATLVNEVSATIKQGRDPQGLDELFSQSAKSLQALMQGTNEPVDWTQIAGLNLDQAPTSALVLVLPKEGQAETVDLFLTENFKALEQDKATHVVAERPLHKSAKITPQIVPQNRIIQAIFMACLLCFMGLFSVLGRINLIVMIVLPIVVGISVAIALTCFALPSLAVAIWPVYVGIGFSALIMAARAAFANVEALSENRSTETAIMFAAQKQGAGIAWQAAIGIAVWIGFLALWGKSAVFLAAIAGTGIFASFIASNMIAPVIIGLSGRVIYWQAQDWIEPLLGAIFDNGVWRGLRTLLTLALLVAACAGLFVASNVLKTKPFQDLADQPVNVVASNIDEAQKSLLQLMLIPQAKAVRWLGAFLPQDVDAKKQALAPLQDQFPKIGSLVAQTPDDLRDQISTLQDSLSDIAAEPATRPELRKAADEFRRSLALLSATSSNAEVIEFENRIFGRFNALHDRANQMAAIEEPNLEELDARLKTLFLSGDNVYRLEVTPIQGESNASLARILFQQGMSVAHPSLVADQQQQSTRSSVLIVLISSAFLGVVVASLGIGETAGAAAAFLTGLVFVVAFMGGLGFERLELSSELLFITVALLSLLFSLLASAFLKAEISNSGLPGALHAVEAWLPVIMVTGCAVPVYLLNIQPAFMPTNLLLAGATLATLVIGFLLRPLCLYFRNV
jgi:uncharacterized protein